MQPSTIEEGFAVVLGRMLAETHTSVRRLEHLSGVSRRTVENWLHGAVRGPRHWEPVLRVSQTLHLSAAETDALLASAGLPRLAALKKATLTPAQSELLMRWQAPGGVMVPARKAADGSGRHNIPASSTGFVGRVELLESLTALLHRPDVWLVTVTGPGGIGKTRLAQEVARRIAGRYRDGVYFVPLENATTADEMIDRLGAGLDIRRSPSVPGDEALLGFLRNKQALLVLDTLEHLLHEADFIGRLQQSAPDVSVLVTSRGVLRLSGEHVFTIPPLAGPTATIDPAVIAQYDAAALFETRVQAVRPDFSLTAENAADIVEICRLLDGLPLALELAAAQTRVLSLSDLRRRLSHSYDLLSGGPRDAPARHRSVLRTLAWSYDLMSPAERDLFHCLSIFGEGCTLAAAEAVAPDYMGDGDQFIDVLSDLIDHSLLQVQNVNGRRIYHMHELTRLFAREKLTASGDEDVVMNRLLDYIHNLAEEMNSHFRSADQAQWINLFEPEKANIWIVLEWGSVSGDAAAVEKCLGLTGNMLQYWNRYGHHDLAGKWTERLIKLARHLGIAQSAQGTALITAASVALIKTEIDLCREYAEAALAASHEAVDTTLEIRSLHLLGLCAFGRGDLDAAGEIWGKSLALAEAFNSPTLLTVTLDDLGNLASQRGDYEQAMALHLREQAISQAEGDVYAEFYAVINLCEVSMFMGQMADAELYNRRALELCREMDDSRGLGQTLVTQAGLLLQLKRPADARTVILEAIRLSWAISNLDTLLRALELLVQAAEDALSVETRVRLAGAVSSLSEQYGSASLPTDIGKFDELSEQLRQGMAPGAYLLEWHIGRALSWEQVVELALTTA